MNDKYITSGRIPEKEALLLKESFELEWAWDNLLSAVKQERNE